MRKAVMTISAVLLAGCVAEPAYRPTPPATAAGALPIPARPAPAQTLAQDPETGARHALLSRYMDGQERDFREHLRGTGVGVARPGNQIVLSLVDHVLFEEGTSRISAAGANALHVIAAIARRYDRTTLTVSAFTDGLTGTTEDGIDPREQARAVAKALIAEGVQRGRVFAQGYSANRRSLSTGRRVSVERNRRVEIRIRA